MSTDAPRAASGREPPPPQAEPALAFPDLPRLELDQLLQQLIDRAGEVIAAQGRLRGLLRANQAIVGQLALPVVLRRIVDAARELVGARYAALGVLGSDGRLAEFVHSGMPDDVVTRIGDLPQGKGILGAVIDDAEPIRLADLGTDPRSSGFPAGHPPMHSFLGVPIRIRDEVFGNLYLSESTRPEFSAEDEELARALAATAAVAIDNARLYRSATVRGEWLAATASLTRQMLADPDGRPLESIARRGLELADADLVFVLLPTTGARDSLRIEHVAAGPGSEEVAGRLRWRTVDVGASLAGHVFATGEPMRLLSPRERAGLLPDPVADEIQAGPTVVVPLLGSTRTEGVLSVVRTVGRPGFGQDDLDMIAGFANQASVAIELAEARAERERLSMLDERERIAADLHDHVIQRLFAAGLSLQSAAVRIGPGPGGDRVQAVVQDLDDTIAQIRTSIFALQQAPGEEAGIRSRILDLVAGAAGPLGFTPVLRMTGPADTLVERDAPLVDDVEAVLREALANVARHARATRVDVDLTAGDARLQVTVVDDGIGPGEHGRRSGLANLRRRAERRGGTFEIEACVPHGTRLSWSVPLA